MRLGDALPPADAMYTAAALTRDSSSLAPVTMTPNTAPLPGGSESSAGSWAWWNEPAFRWGQVECLDGRTLDPDGWDASGGCAVVPRPDNSFGVITKGAAAAIGAVTVVGVGLLIWKFA